MKRLTFLAWSVLMFSACGESKKTQTETDLLVARIDSLESVLFTESEEPADPKAGMELVRAYAKYYQNNKTDSNAVDMLFKAGEVSMGIGQGNLAVKYFTTISKDHKEFSKSPEALFLSGFCEENLNSDTAAARFYYEKFLATYPEHKLAEDAAFSIQNMSMSDEELIKLFEEKAKQSS